MRNEQKEKEQLISELECLRRRVAELEESNTACKNQQDSLSESAEKYRLLIENSHDIIYMLTTGGVFTFVSPGWTNLLGHPVIQVVGKPFQQFVHPDDIGRCEIFLQKVIETGQRQTGVEYRVRNADGYWRWHTTNAVPLMDEAGTVVGFEGIASDITDRKWAEDALKESEQKLTNIIDFLPDATFVIDRDKKVVAWNRAMEEMTGVKKEDMIGRGNYAGSVPFYGERRPYLLELIDADDKELESKYEYVKKKGNALYAEGFTPALYGGKGAYLWATGAPLFDGRGNRIGAIESIRDITERKRAEDALQESEAKFRALAESSSSAIFLIQGTKYIYTNPAFESIIGYKKEDLADMNFWDFVHPDMRELIRNRGLNRLKGQSPPSRYEIKFIAKNGQEKWVDYSATVIELDNKPTIMGSTFDITERKQAEEALRQSEKLYRSVINNIQDTFYRTDINGNITMMSPSGAALFGYDSVEEMSGLNFAQSLYVNPEDREHLISAIEAQGFVKDYEAKLKRSDGTVIYISTSSHQYFDDEGVMLGIEGILRDITGRKRAEEVLRHSEERFSKAFNMSPYPTVISTLDTGLFIDANDSILNMLGYTREEVIGRTANELSIWTSWDVRKYLAKKIIERGFLREEPVHLLTKMGDVRDLLLSSEVVTLNGEKFVLSIFYDITDQKKLEAQLRQSQKMEAIGTLAGGIAHDFNNILSAVIGYTEMALQEPNVGDRLRQYLEQVYKAGERARDLVKQILTFSRQSDEKPRPLRVSPIIKEALKLLRASLPSTIRIRQDIQSDPDTVLANPTHIHQILMNLCSNAAHAMREVKGELKVSLVPVEVKPGDTLIIHHDLSPGMYLKLTVSDAGVGIAPDIMDRIFDPFFTTKKPGEGTGMGLSVVHGIVKSYHGAITVEGEAGKGTDFHVYLPLLEETGAKREVSTAAHIIGGKECILFVDDEEILVNLGKEMLTRLGYKVTGRTSSLDALELFRSGPNRFDLVITDMTMPGMTGTELAKEILRIRPEIPVILCTGFSDAITPERAEYIGLKDFIMKPIIKNQIASAIRRALD